jgi:hypothetical protein
MRENVLVLFYANKSGGTMAKGYMPAQLGCAAIVQTWVEKQLIEEFDLDKDVDVNIHSVEGRGYVIEFKVVEWTHCQKDTLLRRVKEQVMQFVVDFNLKEEYSLVNVDYAMEIAWVRTDGSKYTHERYGNHLYGIEVKHEIEVRNEMLCPLSMADSDWIEENRHGV